MLYTSLLFVAMAQWGTAAGQTEGGCCGKTAAQEEFLDRAEHFLKSEHLGFSEQTSYGLDFLKTGTAFLTTGKEQQSRVSW